MRYIKYLLSNSRIQILIFADCRALRCSAAILLSFCFLVSGCEKKKTEISPEMRMADMFFSRSSIATVNIFREKDHIHALSFFHFNSSGDDISRIVAWLRMREHNNIPPILVDRVLAASVGTNWKFNWNHPKIYVTFYCHPFDGTYWSIDMLLVKDGQAVLVTEGYLPQGSSVTDDPLSCERAQN